MLKHRFHTLAGLGQRAGYRLGAIYSILLLASFLAAPALAQALRAPDVPYEPTPQHIVVQMIELAQLRPNEVIYDLGCGDGRIVITAAREYGAQGVCVDIDPARIRDSRANAAKAGVAEWIRFVQQDLFETDLRDANVVTLFLWPSINLKLRPKLLRELKPGTRVVSYVHSMGDWKPDKTLDVQGAHGPRKVYLWTIPGKPPAR
jgi:SAM-dependent methyltransferase